MNAKTARLDKRIKKFLMLDFLASDRLFVNSRLAKDKLTAQDLHRETGKKNIDLKFFKLHCFHTNALEIHVVLSTRKKKKKSNSSLPS